MIGHHSSYLGWRIHHVWWPRSESLDDVAVHGGVTVRDFIDEYINNEFGSKQSASKGGLVQCAFNSHQPKPNLSVNTTNSIECTLNSVLVTSMQGPLNS